jgi:hypothetical protein
LKKQSLLALLFIAFFFLIINCSVHSTCYANVRNHEALASSVALTIDYGNSTQQVFSNLSGNTVFDILNQTAKVTFSQYMYGKFVVSINDVENNANNNGHYWQYWVNNELAPIAADNYVLSDDDQVLWKYCAPEVTPTTSPTLNLELVLGIGIIGVVGVIVVIAVAIIYLKMR